MGKKKEESQLLPEMEALLEGMQELMCDENGKPLSPDHPQYKKFAGLIENIADRAKRRNENTPPSSSGPQGTA
jgi:acyl-CoA reductase-like NAD-dependent aldehyde dehydrogenase